MKKYSQTGIYINNVQLRYFIPFLQYDWFTGCFVFFGVLFIPYLKINSWIESVQFESKIEAMKTVSIILMLLFPFLASAQHSEFNELGENEVVKDSIIINSIRRISESSIDRATERLMASYPELVAINVDYQAESVKIIYTLPIAEARLNQLTNYFK